MIVKARAHILGLHGSRDLSPMFGPLYFIAQTEGDSYRHGLLSDRMT